MKELRKRAVEIGPDWSDCSLLNSAADEIERLRTDAARYNFLRCRELDAITRGGVFAGMTPINIVLNGEDRDREVDAEMIETPNVQGQGDGKAQL